MKFNILEPDELECMTIEEIEDYLYEEMEKLNGMKAGDIKKLIKSEEIKHTKFKYPKEHYRNMVYMKKKTELVDDTVVDDINPELIILKEYNNDIELHDMWRYLRMMTSSIRTSGSVGKSIRILLRDRHTGKYLGVMSIGSDVNPVEALSKHIGWSTSASKIRKNDLINIWTCVGLQPMTYNLNIGKLLASLAFSKEINEAYRKKYNKDIAGIITTSINGKSIQYDRLKCMKFIGMTKGKGASHFPDHIYETGKYYLKLKGVDLQLLYKKSSPKMRILTQIMIELGLEHEEKEEFLNHGVKRGIYFGYTSTDSKDFLQGKRDDFEPNLMKSADEIIAHWKERWARKRFNHLLSQHKLKVKLEFYDLTRKEKINEASKQYQCRKYLEADDKELFKKINNQQAREYYAKNKNKILNDYFDTICTNDNEIESIPELHINKLHNDDEIENLLNYEHDLDSDDNSLNNYSLYSSFNDCNDIQSLHPSYVGGFIDGDGSIHIHKLKSNTGYQLAISFEQCKANIINIFYRLYGGQMYIQKQESRKNMNKRLSYCYRVCGKKTLKLLNILKEGSIIKINQTNNALNFHDYIDKTNKIDEKEEIYQYNKDLNAQIINPTKDYNRINDQYIIGLFDAEGCIMLSVSNKGNYVKSSITIRISQKNHPDILREIIKYLGYGSMKKNEKKHKDDTHIDITKINDVSKFINLVKNHVIVKKLQIMLIVKYLDHVKKYTNHKDSYDPTKNSHTYHDNIHNYRLNIDQMLHNDKHLDDLTNDDDFHNTKNINIINENINKLYIKKKNQQERKIITSIIQSEKKIGVNNPNYGVERSIEHSLKISISNTNKKRIEHGLTNELIYEILQLKNSGMKQKDIANKFNKNRHTITNIFNGSTLPTDHPDFIKQKRQQIIETNNDKNNIKTVEEEKKINSMKISKGKRTLTIDQYIELIRWKIKRDNKEKIIENGREHTIKSTNIAKILSKEWNIKISNDIVKNFWSGRTKLYEEEFENCDFSYDQYIEICDIKK